MGSEWVTWNPFFHAFFYPPSLFSLSFCAKLKISSHAMPPVYGITPELPNSPPSILRCSFPAMEATIPRQKCAFLSLFFGTGSYLGWMSSYFSLRLKCTRGISWDLLGSSASQHKNTWMGKSDPAEEKHLDLQQS